MAKKATTSKSAKPTGAADAVPLEVEPGVTPADLERVKILAAAHWGRVGPVRTDYMGELTETRQTIARADGSIAFVQQFSPPDWRERVRFLHRRFPKEFGPVSESLLSDHGE